MGLCEPAGLSNAGATSARCHLRDVTGKENDDFPPGLDRRCEGQDKLKDWTRNDAPLTRTAKRNGRSTANLPLFMVLWGSESTDLATHSDAQLKAYASELGAQPGPHAGAKRSGIRRP